MARCYVYALRDGDTIAYVGKGSGSRLNAQKRSFGLEGDKLEDGLTDTQAFAAERKWIAKLSPTLNRCAGGNGNRARRIVNRTPKWEREIDAVGSRRYAAILLMGCERSRPGIIDPSKIDAIRQVANGCRS